MIRQYNLPVEPRSVIFNPDAAKLRELVAAMPNAQHTEFDNYNVGTQVVARSKASTYIVTDSPDDHSDQTIPREEGARVAKLQDEYIAAQEMIVIDGYIGNDAGFRTAARLIIEASNANIAAMQRHLYYDGPGIGSPDFEPELTVIYTPNLKAPDYPNERLIAVDLENCVTRVLHSDYFGESKKGGLRMWNKLVYDRGGLSLHAGCKVIPVGNRSRVGLIVGREGPEASAVKRIWLFVFAITLHNFPEGMAVGVGFAGGDIANGTSLATGIGVQNIPEGLAVAVSLLAIGYTRLQAFLVGTLTGLAEPVGGLFGSVAVSFAGPLMPWALAFAAGAMLFIISDEIIPETHSRGYENLATFSLLIGFACMMYLDATLG